MRKKVSLVLLLAYLLLSASPSTAQQKEGYLQQLVGQTVNVQIERGSGRLQGATLREVHIDGIVVVYEGKEQFIRMEKVISVQKAN
jgi:hypothetical protein